MSVDFWGAPATAAADVSQAAYFLEFLAEEHRSAAADLARAREALRRCQEGSPVGLRAMARARCEARELENQVRELDRLLAALNRRYGATLSTVR